MLSQEPASAPQEPISIHNYIDPGAGLKHLEDWVQDSDFIFDSLFMNSEGATMSNGYTSDVSGTGTPCHGIPMVRTYQSDAAILDAYYVFIHPYLPILPPPTSIPVDQPVPRLQNQMSVYDDAASYEPTSPATLAISAILALIPCPAEAAPQAREAQLFRRKYAQYFAQSAFETIESDEEIPDSSIEPPRALSEEHNHPFRRPLHPRLPVHMERIVALCILSVYEYAQRGNLKKMQNRAGQAMMSAMDLMLHQCTVEDEFSEARRRVWWMSYICVAQGAIVSNTQPAFLVFSPTYTNKLPTFAADPEAFSVYLQAQRAILAATEFVIELNKAVADQADMSPIYSKMRDLEAYLGPLLAHSESWLLTSTTTSPVDPTEAVVARSLRCMAAIKLNSARIKVHRYCAFFDIPVFSRKHCDLKSLSSSPIDGAGDGGGDEPRRWPTCSCSTFANAFPGSGPGSATTPTTGSAGTTSTGLSPSSDGNASGVSYGPGPGGYGSGTLGATPGSTTTTMATTPGAAASSAPPSPPGNFPFTSHHSAKICLKSALAIAHSFDDLPFPNPTGAPPQPPGAPVFLGPASGIVCPRTMPSFACCAMQCAYALLMVHQKTKAMYPPYNPSAAEAMQAQGQAQQGQGQQQQRPVVVNSLVTRLQQGLNSIYATLANYATAFEALGGMRDQIRSAVEDSAAFTV